MNTQQMEDFETFWRAYPRRIGKGAARAEFAKAIGKTTVSNMLSAIAAYIANKPAYQDFKHPRTWLHQECWDDEWTQPAQRNTGRRTTWDAAREINARFDNFDASFGLPQLAKH
jgi:hypothetical protein